jgi:hypothetical protein
LRLVFGKIVGLLAKTLADIDSLLAAVYDRLTEEQAPLCRTVIATAATPSEGARAMIDALCGYLEESPTGPR